MTTTRSAPAGLLEPDARNPYWASGEERVQRCARPAPSIGPACRAAGRLPRSWFHWCDDPFRDVEGHVYLNGGPGGGDGSPYHCPGPGSRRSGCRAPTDGSSDRACSGHAHCSGGPPSRSSDSCDLLACNQSASSLTAKIIPCISGSGACDPGPGTGSVRSAQKSGSRGPSALVAVRAAGHGGTLARAGEGARSRGSMVRRSQQGGNDGDHKGTAGQPPVLRRA